MHDWMLNYMQRHADTIYLVMRCGFRLQAEGCVKPFMHLRQPQPSG